jgi:hypothetical protein
MARKARIAYVAKSASKLTIASNIPSTETNKVKTDKRINELREAAGIPARKFSYKHARFRIQVLVKPDAATISEIKVDRGFVYLNLNGGDSWGYYHPEDNPDFIYNFKGEPTYLTKELLPDYWEQLTQQTTKTNSAGITFLTFLDRKPPAPTTAAPTTRRATRWSSTRPRTRPRCATSPSSTAYRWATSSPNGT